MGELQQEVKHYLDKTTNTIVLDYLLWLSARTILEEASIAATSVNESKSKGRRLVGLVDGLILQFDITNRPKFTYTLLTRRLNLAALVILFVYRDSRSRYITRRSSDTALPSDTNVTSRTRKFLRDQDSDSVVSASLAQKFSAIAVDLQTTREARQLLDMDPEESDNGYRRPPLKDAFEQFMVVSAASYAQSDALPAEMWIKIACQFSLFATIDACLVDRSHHSHTTVLNESFSYAPSEEPKSGNDNIDAVFKQRAGRKYAEFAQMWRHHRYAALAKLEPSTKSNGTVSSLSSHLLSLLRDMNWPEFRMSVITYLTAVLQSMEDPELCKYSGIDAEDSSQVALLDKSILRAPGMISIAHEEAEVRRPNKRVRIST